MDETLKERSTPTLPAEAGQNWSIREAESNNREDRLNTVLPRDLFPFFIAPPVVRHPDFKNAQPRSDLCHLGRDLRLEAEAVALDLDALKY